MGQLVDKIEPAIDDIVGGDGESTECPVLYIPHTRQAVTSYELSDDKGIIGSAYVKGDKTIIYPYYSRDVFTFQNIDLTLFKIDRQKVKYDKEACARFDRDFERFSIRIEPKIMMDLKQAKPIDYIDIHQGDYLVK